MKYSVLSALVVFVLSGCGGEQVAKVDQPTQTLVPEEQLKWRSDFEHSEYGVKINIPRPWKYAFYGRQDDAGHIYFAGEELQRSAAGGMPTNSKLFGKFHTNRDTWDGMKDSELATTINGKEAYHSRETKGQKGVFTIIKINDQHFFSLFVVPPVSPYASYEKSLPGYDYILENIEFHDPQ